MSAGWISAVAIVETTDAPLLVQILEGRVSGADATYWSKEHFCVIPDTEEAEVMLRLALPDWDSIGGIRIVGERGYLLPSRLSDDVHRWLDEGLFEGAAAALTVIGLEIRDDGVFQRLGAALEEARASFLGQPPQFGCI